MKNIITTIIVVLSINISQAQKSNFDKLWKDVEKHEKNGLPKSALKVVEDISKQAKAANNTPQLIKTMLYKSKFALDLEEDAQLNIINDFKTQINQSTFPTKNILESLLANLYWQYFNENRWQFYNRTKTAEKVDAKDFRTWDLTTLFNEIHLHYQKSLENGVLLQQQDLNAFNAILQQAEGSKIYRPTLFDFLNHQALAFYKTDENQITKPAYKFEIDNPAYLSDAKTFSTIALASKDSTSLQLQALKIYQNLIQFHLKKDTPFALADVNIDRLNFVHQHATFSEKQNLLLNTLKTERDLIKSHEVSGLYDFEIATIFYNESTKYTDNKEESIRWKAKEAMAICENVIATFPKSKAAEKCIVLKNQITEKSLNINTEGFLPIQTSGRLLVTYKNINSLNFEIFEISRSQLEKFNKIYNEDEQQAFIKTLTSEKSWKSSLRNELDYQMHSTEIVIPKLNNGTYIIVASLENNNALFAFSTIQITNLALVQTENQGKTIYQIIDRINGKPVAKAQVELSYHNYNNDNVSKNNYTTDNNGEIKAEYNSNAGHTISIKISTNKETAYFGNYYSNPYYGGDQNTETDAYKGFVFTDRSIYRPGQTVYFKAIAMKKSKDKSEVLANQSVKVTLFNVNGETLKELDLTTNEFGSVSNEFILLSNGLNGQYRIKFNALSGNKAIYTEHYFSVEEYKRPKFETTFNPVTETFKVNDSVTVKGKALAYSGSTITNAKVLYRVHRKVQHPIWCYWYKPWFNSEPQEITHGETTTNDKGEFDITFNAIPDLSVNKDNQPIFNYEITADVTDINGETRSATTIVNVGYHALDAKLNVAQVLDKTKKDHKITIDTKNLNGEFVPAKGSIKIYKLIAPNTVVRTRPWLAPDYQDITETGFKALFPNDAYANEHDAKNWKKGNLVFEKTFDTNLSKTIALETIEQWKSGQYTIILESEDRFGQAVKDEVRTTLFSDKDKTLADNQLFSISTDKDSYTTNDTAKITLASAAQDITVTLRIEKNHKLVETKIISLNNNKKTISIPVEANDVGGFAVYYTYAAFNSFDSGILNIAIPYPKTDLDIETTTFRDKLQPGTNETWTFKIKGPKGDKVSAELLASMYDMSLDQFTPHQWSFNPIEKPLYYTYNRSSAHQSFGTRGFDVYNDFLNANYSEQLYDQMNWFGFRFNNRENVMLRGVGNIRKESSPPPTSQDIMVEDAVGVNYGIEQLNVRDGYSYKKGDIAGHLSKVDTVDFDLTEAPTNKPNFNNIKIRKNLQETAFFFPQLQTDAEGNVSFSFNTPEALTQWKLQLLAHTKTLESATKTLTTVTQKELMVTPNAPRFLRQGDHIVISTKIANLTDKQLKGQAALILTDAITGKDITKKLLSAPLTGELEGASFTVPAKGNTQVSWNLSIPDNVDAVQYKIVAKSGDFNDGEQNALPVLSNRMLVTETMPMWIKSNETKTFTLNKLKFNTSTTLKNHMLTLEMTSNPAWYAVQALPYLMEYPYDCNEQTFSRYYANALASHIANSNPRIQEVFNQWKNTDALVSNLEKNEELKSILIQETPWLRDAQSETEQKKRIALLFDLNKMKSELESAFNKLKANQMGSGAWPWFNGGQESRYITQHIITGFGHLKNLGVVKNLNEASYNSMIQSAVKYLDNEFVQEYKDLKKYDSKVDLSKDHLSYTQLHYLYMRSFFTDIEKSNEIKEIIKYYQTQIEKYWLSRPLYAKGLMALVSYRNGDSKTVSKIINSLKETSITSPELGMYWKENSNSWYWYQAPIETQALLIEAFSEIGNDTETIDNLKIWLLKNKQTNQWKTTKATTDAVYALLLKGSDWLSVTEQVDVTVDGKQIEPSKLENVKVEAGTGYYKTAWTGSEIKPEMAEVKLTKKGDGIAWGGLYWQYFEDLDKITSAETPLKLKKKLFLKTNTDLGEQITEITDKTKLKVGDLVRVRIELRSDRPMEFVHMKDMRAAGFEPVNVISQYKWQDGLGYYESTKDASTNFFFDYLPKGIYVFEYDLRVNNAGNMSNGITTIQSIYAPEFSSHSEGVRVLID